MPFMPQVDAAHKNLVQEFITEASTKGGIGLLVGAAVALVLFRRGSSGSRGVIMGFGVGAGIGSAYTNSNAKFLALQARATSAPVAPVAPVVPAAAAAAAAVMPADPTPAAAAEPTRA